MNMRLGHLAVTTRDMEKSLDFYTGVLGFERLFDMLHPETGKPWIVYVSMGNGQFIELFYGGETDNPWNSGLRGFNHICVIVDDIHAAAKKIADASYPIDRAPRQGVDGNWQFWITDPDGIRIEFMQIDKNSPQGRIIANL